MKLLSLLALAAVAIVPVRPAAAQDGEPLTSERIERWISTLEDLTDWSEGREDVDAALVPGRPADGMQAIGDPFRTALKAIESLDEYDEVLSIIESNGYDDSAEWAETGNRIVMAYTSLRMAAEEPNVSQEIQKALDELEKSGLSDEQKESMREMLLASADAMQTYSNAPIQDQDALKPYLERLDGIFDSQ